MKKYIYSLGIVLLICFHMSNILVWYGKNYWPIGKDYAHHLEMTSNFIKKMPGCELKDWEEFIFISENDNPPFYYWTAIFLYFLLRNYHVLFLNSALYFIILLLSVYGIGKELKSKEAGFLAAVICSFFPFIYLTSIQYNLELATAAMAALIVYVMLLSKGFSKYFYTILFCAALLLGIFTRQLVFVFIIGPLVITIIEIAKNNNIPQRLKKQRFKRLGVVLTSTFLFSLLYYRVVSFSHHMVKKMSITGWVYSRNIFSKEHLLYYIRILPLQIGWIFTGIFCISLLFFHLFDKKTKQVLLSWYVPSFVIMSFVFLKFPEYTIANISVIALVISISICSIKEESAKKLAALMIVLIGLCGYFSNFPW